MTSPLARKAALLCLLATAPVLLVMVLVPAFPQDQAYHRFADNRTLLGIPNVWNVLSSLPLLLAGGWGLWLEKRRRLVHDNPAGAPVYRLFFIGVALTGIGSGCYHWAPDNATLFWDRLPMTLGFTSLAVGVLAEHVNAGLARRLLAPLLVMGVASACYWHYTELLGRGDLRPYAVVQFLPLLLLPVVCLLFQSRFTRAHDLWGVLVLYLLGKLAEQFDAAIFALSGAWLGGHALKHLLAALAVCWLVRMLWLRRLAGDDRHNPHEAEAAT